MMKSYALCLVKDEMAQYCAAIIFCACKARLEEHSVLRESSRNDVGVKRAIKIRQF